MVNIQLHSILIHSLPLDGQMKSGGTPRPYGPHAGGCRETIARAGTAAIRTSTGQAQHFRWLWHHERLLIAKNKTFADAGVIGKEGLKIMS